MAIKDFLQSLWRSVEADGDSIATDAEKIIVDFATNAMHQIEQNGGPALVDAAMRAVIQAEAAGGASADKFAIAVKAVENTLMGQGLPVVENAVRLAVETAVANLQDSKGLLPLVTRIAVDASTAKPAEPPTADPSIGGQITTSTPTRPGSGAATGGNAGQKDGNS